MGEPKQMFLRSEAGVDGALRQGEILTNVVELQIEIETIHSGGGSSAYRANPVCHPFAIIVSQDCDLEQDYNYRYRNRGNERHELPSILFCQAEDADELARSERYRGLFNSGTFKRSFIQNNALRYHFIQKVPAECDAENKGLPELGVDFKRYFSMPSGEVYRRIHLGDTRRRAILNSPYREHFCDRFYNFNARIALPEEYASD